MINRIACGLFPNEKVPHLLKLHTSAAASKLRSKCRVFAGTVVISFGILTVVLPDCSPLCTCTVKLIEAVLCCISLEFHACVGTKYCIQVSNTSSCKQLLVPLRRAHIIPTTMTRTNQKKERGGEETTTTTKTNAEMTNGVE